MGMPYTYKGKAILTIDEELLAAEIRLKETKEDIIKNGKNWHEETLLANLDFLNETKEDIRRLKKIN